MQGSKPASRIVYLLKVSAAGVAFAGLVYFSDTTALVAALNEADYRFVAAGSAIFLYGQYLAAQRWRGVLASGELGVSRFEAFRLNLVGTFIGNFLPGQGSGDLVKSAFLFGRFPGRRAFLLASVVYDRLLGLSAMLTLAVAGMLILGLVAGDWPMISAFGWMLGGVLALGALLMLFYRLQPFDGFFRERLGKRFAGFSGEIAELFGNRRLFLRSFALSMIFQLSWALSLWMMLRAVRDAVPLVPVLLAAPLSVLIASVPISLGGLGVREGAFSLLMQRFGISADVATAGALLSLVPLLFASFLGAGLASKAYARRSRAT
jgi:glycosyltransferase 2 family protein